MFYCLSAVAALVILFIILDMAASRYDSHRVDDPAFLAGLAAGMALGDSGDHAEDSHRD